MKLLDCLGGLEYAIRLGWFNYKTFNLAEYEHYEKIENGDLNWIVPHKFVAFSSPSDKTIDKYGVFLT
jgi:cell division cycle 14